MPPFKALPLASLLASVLVSLSVAALCAAAAPPVAVYPSSEPAYTRTLNGSWSFKYLPGLEIGADSGFTAPQFDTSAWATIPVRMRTMSSPCASAPSRMALSLI